MKKDKKENGRTALVKNSVKKKPNIKLAAFLVLSTALIFGLYRFMLETPYFGVLLIAYMIIFAVLTLGYVIYNRGFSRNGVTADMLPDSMSAEEKNDFISDAVDRKSRSKWVLALIFAFIFTFGIDLLLLFIKDNILSRF